VPGHNLTLDAANDEVDRDVVTRSEGSGDRAKQRGNSLHGVSRSRVAKDMAKDMNPRFVYFEEHQTSGPNASGCLKVSSSH
jgi:hypothetical protein